MRRLLRLSVVLGVVGMAGFLGIVMWAHSAPRPVNLGLTEGHLTPCPPTPNCVASEQAAPAQLMPPLGYATNVEVAKERLIEIVQGLPRTTFIADHGAYMAAEFCTPVIGFIDDVEFRFDDTAKVIHFRSASRLGRHDLGVNRARMTAISDAFNNQTPALKADEHLPKQCDQKALGAFHSARLTTFRFRQQQFCVRRTRPLCTTAP